MQVVEVRKGVNNYCRENISQSEPFHQRHSNDHSLNCQDEAGGKMLDITKILGGIVKVIASTSTLPTSKFSSQCRRYCTHVLSGNEVVMQTRGR